MLRYRLENKENKWKNMIKKTEDSSNNMEDIIKIFYDQLKEDEHNFNNNKEVSDCAFNTPRTGSSIDKKNKFAHKLLFKLYPIEDNNKPIKVMKSWSYIRYSKLISMLTKKFKEKLKKDDEERNSFKRIKMTGQRKNFCTLKKKCPSKAVLEPSPMIVNVAPLKDLEPFFDFMKKDLPVPKNISADNSNATKLGQEKDIRGANYVRFKRGAFYDDGRIDMCKQVVGRPFISNLMQSIEHNKYVDHFLLGNNIINSKGAEEIANFIRNKNTKPKIKTWYIAGNEIDSNGIKKIAKALEDDEYADSLWLKRNPIMSEGAKYLGEMLKKNKTLEILDLNNTGIFDEGVKYIMRGLRYNNTLQVLYMDANAITPVGTKYICDYFEYLVKKGRKGITSLWLDMNRLDDEGIIMLANSLRNYKFLERLVVGSNRIGPGGIKVLLDALVDHDNLILLDVGLYKSTSDMGELPNNICDEGAKYVAKFIEKNKSVQIMNIEHNNITEKGLEIVFNALEKNKTMLYLYYAQRGVKIDKKLMNKLKEKMRENIKNNLGITLQEFVSNKRRYIKHTDKIKYIDSIYRNNM